MILSDLVEARKIFEIDPNDTSEDAKLSLFLTIASDWISDFLDRPGLFYQQRTEYYRGTGTQKLLLRSRPVYTTDLAVYQDTRAFYGSADGAFASSSALLTYGQDYCLQIDEGTTRSRCGILLRINNYWPRPFARAYPFLSPFVSDDMGSIRVTYYGGYTIDELPSGIRMGCNAILAGLRYVFPLGMLLSSESFEERSIKVEIEKNRDYLFSLAKPFLVTMRNWTFG